MCPTSASRKLKSLPFLSLSSIFPLTWFSASPSSATDWMADWLALPLKSRSSEWNYLIYILYCKLSWFWLLFRRATNKQRSRHKFLHHLYDTATPRKGTGCHQNNNNQFIQQVNEWMFHLHDDYEERSIWNSSSSINTVRLCTWHYFTESDINEAKCAINCG